MLIIHPKFHHFHLNKKKYYLILLLKNFCLPLQIFNQDSQAFLAYNQNYIYNFQINNNYTHIKALKFRLFKIGKTANFINFLRNSSKK
jgi:hypothetical protein